MAINFTFEGRNEEIKMSLNMFGYEIKPAFVDLDGNAIEKTPFSHPYNYDEYVLWKSENYTKEKPYSGVYSDRLFQWNHDKYNDCCQKVFKNKGQDFSKRESYEIEEFLRLYLNEKDLKLIAVLQGCNIATGYPYWVFLYRNQCIGDIKREEYHG